MMTPEEKLTKFHNWIDNSMSEVESWEKRLPDNLKELKSSLTTMKQLGIAPPLVNMTVGRIIHIKYHMDRLMMMFHILKENE